MAAAASVPDRCGHQEVEMAIARGGLAALVAAALGFGSPPATADDALDGVTILTNAYDPVPASASFDLQVAADSALTYEIEQLVRSNLQHRGYGLSADAPLVLTVAAETTERSADTPWPMQLGASKGGLRMRLFLIGPNSSGLLQDSREPTAGEYRISLSIHDRRAHGYLWRGLATTCQCGQGMLASSRAMVAALIEAIGRSVGPEPIVAGTSNQPP
jgi:hypothetical protein